MRKLLLASFAWKIGENQHTDSRLIAIDSTPNTLEETDRHNAIAAFLNWWEEVKTEEQEFLFVQCHPTIDGTKQGLIVKYGNRLTSFPPKHGDPEQNLSRKVVIDLNGYRKYFVIGWYDFDNKDWTFDHDDISILEKDHAVWLDILPLD